MANRLTILICMIAVTLLIGCGDKKEEIDEFEYYGETTNTSSGEQSVGTPVVDSKEDGSEKQATENLHVQGGSHSDAQGSGEVSGKRQTQTSNTLGAVAAGYVLGNALAPTKTVVKEVRVKSSPKRSKYYGKKKKTFFKKSKKKYKRSKKRYRRSKRRRR